MIVHAPVLLITIPLATAFGAALLGLAGERGRPWIPWLALAGLLAAGVLAVLAAGHVALSDDLAYVVSGWKAPAGIELKLDRLNAPLAVVLFLVAGLSLFHSRLILPGVLGARTPWFYVLSMLLVTALTGITVTGDAFNLYVFLEIAALSTYGLIAMGGGRAWLATFNYVLMGSVGASFYLLGVGFLFMMTGSLNMADLGTLLLDQYHSAAVMAGLVLMMAGLFLKMGLFPAHGWLPNAYYYAPDPVSSLVGPLATKVAVYVALRLTVTVFTPAYVFISLGWHGSVVALASAAIAVGAAFALMQDDLKKMITYIIVAEAGYMVGGIWLGNEAGMVGASFHLLNDALATLCLMLVVANVGMRQGGHGLDRLRGAFRTMPLTMGALVLAALTVVGVPPMPGFFSKFWLLRGALEAGHPIFAAALILASLGNVFLFFRVFELALFEEPPEGAGGEAPPSMVAAAWAAGLALLALGLAAEPVMAVFLRPGVGS